MPLAADLVDRASQRVETPCAPALRCRAPALRRCVRDGMTLPARGAALPDRLPPTTDIHATTA